MRARDARPIMARSIPEERRMPAFDTLKATKLLKASGFEETQAEAVVATVKNAVADNVATKTDVGELRTEFKTDIAELRTELKTDIAELRTELKTEMGALRAEVKAEIGELRAEFKTDIAELRTELKTEIGELRASTYRIVLTTSLAVIGATVSLIKLLP